MCVCGCCGYAQKILQKVIDGQLFHDTINGVSLFEDLVLVSPIAGLYTLQFTALSHHLAEYPSTMTVGVVPGTAVASR